MGMPDPATGRLGPPQWSATFRTQEAADKDQRDTRKAIADGTYASDRGKTVAHFLAEWLASKRVEGMSPNSLAEYASKINVHLLPHLGHLRLGQLRTHHIQNMIDTVARTPSARTGEPVKAVTLSGLLRVTHNVLEDALRLQLITQNWAGRVTAPKVRTVRPIDLGREKAAAFLRHIEGERLAAMWLMYVLYPTRRSEIIGLRWPDLNTTIGQFEIRQVLTRPKGDWPCPFCGGTHSYRYFGPPKSAAGARPIPLVDVVATALVGHRERQDRERQLHGSDYVDHQLIFCETDGEPLKPDNVSIDFVAQMKAAGLTAANGKATLKMLRSSAVNALHERDVDLEVITAVTGHRPDGEITRKHYLDVKAERARGPFEAIAQALLGNEERRDAGAT